MSKSQADKMENDLSGTKHELLKIREMLELTEKVCIWDKKNVLMFCPILAKFQ